jgi:murein L,D-transpeptidase YafK
VPEGIYGIEFLNPNSRFHLSLRLNYPNAFDRQMALRDKRTNLGGDIMIHGGALSVGCLAMGDPAAEDLFMLVADVGRGNSAAILAPYDFRKRAAKVPAGSPQWTIELYRQVEKRLRELSHVPI